MPRFELGVWSHFRECSCEASHSSYSRHCPEPCMSKTELASLIAKIATRPSGCLPPRSGRSHPVKEVPTSWATTGLLRSNNVAGPPAAAPPSRLCRSLGRRSWRREFSLLINDTTVLPQRGILLVPPPPASPLIRPMDHKLIDPVVVIRERVVAIHALRILAIVFVLGTENLAAKGSVQFLAAKILLATSGPTPEGGPVEEAARPTVNASCPTVA
mmetsp:Transcript_95246/g.273074  ORF Transcript_95246/g.273074 Transcript_95246/m.273074 type:complete len:215 (+) Transcript_95246:93-737(+)